MSDVYYGFKVGVGFLVAQLLFGTIAVGIGLAVLTTLGLTIAHSI